MPLTIDVVYYCYGVAALPCFLLEESPMILLQALATPLDIAVATAESQAWPTLWSQ